MKVLDIAKERIIRLGRCKAAYTVAQAAASACSQNYGVSLLRIDVGLDNRNRELILELMTISKQTDYSNAEQGAMLDWLEENNLLCEAPYNPEI